MLTMYENDIYVIDAVEAGAVGYLLKDTSRDLLLHTIKAAHSGVTLIKSSVLRAALAHKNEGQETAGPPASSVLFDPGHSAESIALPDASPTGPTRRFVPGMITTREMEVLALLVQGCTNKEIAEKLFITTLTVKKHVSSIILKLGAANRSDAAVRAVRAHIVRSS